MIEYTVKVHENGTKTWYQNGQYHREDGPAVEYADGSKFWYLNGQLHREDGPAIEWDNGTKWWYLNGKLHREDGPAVEWADGTKSWYKNGQLHRDDNGPVIILADGTELWYLNGQYLNKEEYDFRKDPLEKLIQSLTKNKLYVGINEDIHSSVSKTLDYGMFDYINNMNDAMTLVPLDHGAKIVIESFRSGSLKSQNSVVYYVDITFPLDYDHSFQGHCKSLATAITIASLKAIQFIRKKY